MAACKHYYSYLQISEDMSHVMEVTPAMWWVLQPPALHAYHFYKYLFHSSSRPYQARSRVPQRRCKGGQSPPTPQQGSLPNHTAVATRWCRNPRCPQGWHTSCLSPTSPSHLRPHISQGLPRQTAAPPVLGSSRRHQEQPWCLSSCLGAGAGTGQPPKVPTSHPGLSFFTLWELRRWRETMSSCKWFA